MKKYNLMVLAIDLEHDSSKGCPECGQHSYVCLPGPFIANLSHAIDCPLDHEIREWLHENDIRNRFRDKGTLGFGKYKS